MADFTIDAHDVTKLAADLQKSGQRYPGEAHRIVETHAYKVKQGMRADFGGHPWFAGVPSQINYTMSGDGLSVEIGVDKGGVGDLGNIMAFGTSRHAASVDMTAAQGRELPATIKAFEDLAARTAT